MYSWKLRMRVGSPNFLWSSLTSGYLRDSSFASMFSLRILYSSN